MKGYKRVPQKAGDRGCGDERCNICFCWVKEDTLGDVLCIEDDSEIDFDTVFNTSERTVLCIPEDEDGVEKEIPQYRKGEA